MHLSPHLFTIIPSPLKSSCPSFPSLSFIVSKLYSPASTYILNSLVRLQVSWPCLAKSQSSLHSLLYLCKPNVAGQTQTQNHHFQLKKTNLMVGSWCNYYTLFPPRPVALKVWPPGQQYQCHLGSCEKWKFLVGFHSRLELENLGLEPNNLEFNQASRWVWGTGSHMFAW